VPGCFYTFSFLTFFLQQKKVSKKCRPLL